MPKQVKVNVDDSFHLDDHVGSARVVIRHFEGRFIVASSLYLPNISSAAAAEAIAMREGLILANHLGCSNVQAESDSMEIIEACTWEETWWGESATIYAECVDLVILIGGVQFHHCLREANEIVHEFS
jgi:ribonuclease HI